MGDIGRFRGDIGGVLLRTVPPAFWSFSVKSCCKLFCFRLNGLMVRRTLRMKNSSRHCCGKVHGLDVRGLEKSANFSCYGFFSVIFR